MDEFDWLEKFKKVSQDTTDRFELCITNKNSKDWVVHKNSFEKDLKELEHNMRSGFKYLDKIRLVNVKKNFSLSLIYPSKKEIKDGKITIGSNVQIELNYPRHGLRQGVVIDITGVDTTHQKMHLGQYKILYKDDGVVKTVNKTRSKIKEIGNRKQKILLAVESRLSQVVEHIRYKPGGSGYIVALNSFNEHR
jgi:hypothetical protein